MSDYREKEKQAKGLLLAIVGPIVENLPGWHIVPEPEDDDRCGRSSVTIANGSGPEIYACWQGYNETKRISFSPNSWPRYTDEYGHSKSVTPRDAIKYDAVAPTTSVDATRATLKRDHAANQVMAKLIGPYLVMYEACTARAKEWGAYADDLTAKRHALLSACDLPESKGDARGFTWYCGSRYISIEQRSADNIRIEGLTTAEAVELLTRIREARA